MDLNTVLFAFSLTLLAGLSTGIGSAIAFFAKQTNTRFLSASLGLSAGVMIYVSFMEILPEAIESLSAAHGEHKGGWLGVGAFFAGIALVAAIDKLVPDEGNPHEVKMVEAMEGGEPKDKARLMRMGLMSALAIALHNFPEGIATFAAALQDPAIGVSIAIAVAIHNIPEGIAVSVPVFYATGSRKKAFLYSFLSGLSEPLGALFGFVVLRAVLNEAALGYLLAGVAGIMVFISLDELFPAAREYGKSHLAIYGLVAGMAIMAVSLLMLH